LACVHVVHWVRRKRARAPRAMSVSSAVFGKCALDVASGRAKGKRAGRRGSTRKASLRLA
jgi:hypothetical protein